MKKLFCAFLDEVKPDVVHFQHLVGLGAGCLEAAAERGIRSVMTLHDFWAMCPMGQRVCYTDFQICDPIKFEKCGPCVFGDGWVNPGVDRPAEPGRRLGVLDRFESFFHRRVAATPGFFARRPRAAWWAARETVGSVVGRVFGDPGERSAAPPPGNPFVERFEDLKAALAGVDLLITPSAFLREEFIKHFAVAPERIEGVHVLVDAFLRAVAGRVDLELHVFGAPNRWTQPYFDELKQKTAHCPFVTFHGRFDNKKISTVLQQFDVLVLPSIWFENAPLTLNEAAISGTPILVSDRGGMLEFVRCNNYGWTFKLGDAQDLADKMHRLADDPTLVPTLGGNPPRIKSVEANSDELLAVYGRLLDGTWRAPVAASAPRADTSVVPAR
jgi:glycosyltransferase involved in cell wall biosynthesis